MCLSKCKVMTVPFHCAQDVFCLLLSVMPLLIDTDETVTALICHARTAVSLVLLSFRGSTNENANVPLLFHLWNNI